MAGVSTRSGGRAAAGSNAGAGAPSKEAPHVALPDSLTGYNKSVLRAFVIYRLSLLESELAGVDDDERDERLEAEAIACARAFAAAHLGHVDGEREKRHARGRATTWTPFWRSTPHS